MILKQSTTYTRQFLMVLSSDHITGATGKTVTVNLGKAGATGAAAGASPAIEIDSTNLPGWYKIPLTIVDTNTGGDLSYHCTASACDPTDFVDQVQATIFPDLQLAASGRALISDNLQQNTALAGYQFLMINATTGQAAPGLTVTAQRSLGGAGFAPCANAPTEISNGVYTINFAASDLNAATVMLHFTATGAADYNAVLITTP